jgi:hypothetical protein
MWNNRVNRINHFALGLAGLTGIIPLSLGAWAQEIPVSAHTSSAAAALTGGTGARACSEADASGRTIEPYTATRKAAVAQPFGHAERQQQAAEGDAHQRDDEGEPAGVGAGAGGREAAQQGLKQQAGQQAPRPPSTRPIAAVGGFRRRVGWA